MLGVVGVEYVEYVEYVALCCVRKTENKKRQRQTKS
jgi:hypothetical protein